MTLAQPPFVPSSSAPEAQAEEARQLWRNYRAAAPASGDASALELAAYAEGRLRGAARDAVEAYLARTPQALADVIAARAEFAGSAPRAKPSVVKRPSILDQLGWGAALCGFCLAVWVGFAKGEQVASTDSETSVLYAVAGDENVDL